MSLLPNVFSDPALRTRQDQLNSQWVALNATLSQCGLTPSSAPAFQQFYADFYQWQIFYDGGNDWTSASKKATDEWQTKIQEYTRTLKPYCFGGSSAGDSAYIPGIKDPPPDEPGFLDNLKVPNPLDWLGVTTGLKYAGIGLIIIVALLIIGVVYLVTKGKFSGFGVEVGK